MATRGLNKEVLSSLAPDLPPQLEGTDLLINKLSLQALALANTGRFPEAHARLADAEKRCASTCEFAGEIDRTAGLLEIRESHTESAEAYFRSSLQIARQNRNHLMEASDLMNLGVVAMDKELFDESADWFEQALRASASIGSALGQAKAMGNLGWDYYKMGDFERSLDTFRETSKRDQELGSIRDQINDFNSLGLVYFQENQLQLAGENYRKSLDLAQRTQSTDLVLSSLNALAYLSVKTGDLASAKDYGQQAFELAHRMGDRQGELYALLAQGQTAELSSDALTAEQLFSQVARDKASDTSAKWEAQNSLGKLYESENRASEANAAYRKALATVENARSSIQHEDFRLPFLANAAHLYDDYIHFLITHGKKIQALQAADYSRAQTLEEGLGLRGAKGGRHSTAPTEIADIARKTNTTILFYWLGPEHSYLWAISSRETKLISLPSAGNINELVGHYNRVLTAARDPLEIANAEGMQLYDVLVKPVEKLVPRDSRVVIIPDGSLNTLNFETLLVPKPQLHYWIDDVTVLTASSLRLLADARQGALHNGKLLLIGDPVVASPDYGVLPNASLEIDDVEKHFPQDRREVYVHEQATPAAYLASQPERFSVIHFVAHGTASTLSPLDSSVVLSKDASSDSTFKLYARDVISHPLHADLVTISSCYGAGTRFYTGEGLIGLSWSFLRAGARNVVGALWAVSDTSTPQFMDDFYAELAKGRAPENALRAAKLHMLRSNTVFRKPFYWAPFQLYTGD
ncbi:MAG TPA: CHAT domain-containing tetratricopeptide repeat protein [Terriglobales bacterium]|nr:CHAT domain-containing tetratricopeptide repeat protein [Terriglobales bacterium]